MKDMKTLFRLTLVLYVAIFPMVLNAQWHTVNQYLTHPIEVKFVDINLGAVLTPMSLRLTTDGGVTFDTAFYRPDIAWGKSLNFIDSSTISFLKNNKLFISSDLGTTWDSVMLPHIFNNLVFLNDTNLIGKAGTSLLRSNNRGVTWQTVLTGLSSNWFSYEFPHPDTGYVHDADSIYLTYNGGSTWTSQPSLPGYTIYFPSDSTWFGIKSGPDSIYVAKTTDRGTSWSFIFQGFYGNSGYHFNLVRFANTQVGYIGGFGTILCTYDGGYTWVRHHNDLNGTISGFNDYINDIYCLNQDTVFAVELNGSLFRTTRGSDSTRRLIGLGATTPLYEPCGTGTLYVAINFPAKDTMVVHFDAMFGTATNGVDFVHIPDSVVFMPGMDVAEIPILVIDDTLVEGPEFFSVVIHNTLFKDTATFWIHDEVPVPFSYNLSPPERFVCWSATQTNFTANLTGGAWPYSVTWYDTFGILSQHNSLINLPIVPYHRTIYVEITDNSICQPLLDSVHLWYFDSCKVEIQSSHPGPVPVGVPVTYSLVHDCATAGMNNRWSINGQFLYFNTDQITHTWSQTGVNNLAIEVMHTCGHLQNELIEDVITSMEKLESNGTLQVSQTDNASWLLTGEGLPPGNLSLQVFDMGGRLIHQLQLHTDNGALQYTLSLPHKAQGIYLLHVVSDNEFSFREKIVKR